MTKLMSKLADIIGRDAPPDDPLDPDDVVRIRQIRTGIREVSRELRRRHPWLDRNQSAIGLAILLVSAAVMAACATAFAKHAMPAWSAIIAIAFACSIAHEIEHDLIHRLYFPRTPVVYHAMMALGWLMRPSTVNPWIRGAYHLNHHRVSGTPTDVEERAITNGERWGVGRLFMTADNFASVLLRLPRLPPKRAFRMWLRSTLAHFPLGWTYHAALVGFVALHAWGFAAASSSQAPPAWVEHARSTLDLIAVIWVWPNLVRTFCLHFVSSNVHYYGDIRVGDILRQTQVIDRWWFLPLQAFCFNFGSTHAIHHFWVSEPFYIRQTTARAAHAIMRAHGVRFNDMGTFRRANRYDLPRGPGVVVRPM
jgi:hypothetical protein